MVVSNAIITSIPPFNVEGIKRETFLFKKKKKRKKKMKKILVTEIKGEILLVHLLGEYLKY